MGRNTGITLLATLFVLLMSGAVNAQLTGTKTVPGDYATVAAAVTDLNTQGVGAGGVIIDVAAGHTETAPAGGISLTATGTLANPIIIQKSGAGANPLITAYTGGTGTPSTAVQDGIFSLVGSDYVTIDGIDLTENALNTTNPSTMEYGYGLFKASATNGCQNNTIKNCVVTLSRVNNASGSGPSVEGSRAINIVNATFAAQATTLTVTSAAGSNSNNKFYGNVLQNCNYGISLIGFADSSPFTLADTGNDIGGNAPANGNTILNFGGAASASNPAAGVRTLAQYGLNVSFNTLNNNDGTGANHVTTLRGVFVNTATSANSTVENNTVTLKSDATTSTITAIEVAAGSTSATNTINVNHNQIVNCTYTTATSGVFNGILVSSSPTTVNINNNTISNYNHSTVALSGSGTLAMITSTGSATNVNANGNTVNGITVNGSTGGIVHAIYLSSGTNQTANNNNIYNIIINGTGTGGTIYGMRLAATTVVANGNTIYDLLNNKASGTGPSYGIYDLSSPSNENYNNNTIYNITHAGVAVVGGIYTNTAAGTRTVSGNTIYGLSSGGGAVYGIYQFNSTPNIFKNKIYNLTSTGAAGTAFGIHIGSGNNTFSIYNNIIGDIKAPTASAADPVRGINIPSTTTSNINVFYNTIYLNATSSGTNFGSSGVFHAASATAATAALNLRNNIIINNSTPNGTGITAAYKRSGTALANFVSSSNNNIFYAGTPSATRAIFSDGTNIDQTIAAYKSRVSPRETSSLTENTPFLSLTGSSSNFLHIDPAVPTQAESGGVNIAGFTDDYDGQVRQGNPGYAGTGSAPDIGADEGNFILLDVVAPTINHTPATYICATGDRILTVNITDASGVPLVGANVPRIYYRKNSGAWFSQAGVNTSGTATNANFDFTIVAADMGGLVLNDTVRYYIIAQDLAGTPNISSNPSGVVATDVNTVTTPPATVLSYTINGVLAGTYTIGVGGDYTTLTAAANAYNNSCLTAAVVFELMDNTYPTETFPITFNANTTANATNTLTIRPKTGFTPLITGSNAAAIIKINGGDYITIDGSNNGTSTRDLTVENTNAGTSSIAIWIASATTDGATNNTIKNLNVRGNAPLTTLACIFSGSGVTPGGIAEANNTNCSIINNSVGKSQYGIAIAGAVALNTGNIISQNSIGSSTAGERIGFVGIFVSNNNGVEVKNNTIFDIITSANNPIGINIAANVVNSTFDANNIRSIRYTGVDGYGGKGIAVNTATANSNLTISNNFISDILGDGFSTGTFIEDCIMGIRLSGTTGGVKIYNNTVNLGSGSFAGNTSGTFSTALYIASGVTNLDIRNNILRTNLVNSNASSAKSYTIYSVPANTVYTNINNNNYAVAGTQGVLAYIGTDRTTLAAIQTGFGQNTNSMNIAPVFVSATDLHLPLAANIGLVDKAVSIAAVTTDIDGQPRGTTPDVGADEFGDSPSTPISLTQSFITPSCTGGSSLYALPAAPANVTYYLQANATDTSTANPFVGDSIIVFTNGTYHVRARNSVTNLWSASTASVVVNNIPVAPLPPSPVADQSPACLTTNVTVPAPVDPNVTFYWQGTTLGGTSNAQNAVTPLTVTASGTYYVAAFDASSNCWSNTNGVSVVIDTQVPNAPVVLPSSASICVGQSKLLVAPFSMLTQSSGNGTSSSALTSTTATLGPNPLQNYYGGTKQQMLFTASELTAMGLVAGYPISSIEIQMNAVAAGYPLQDLRVKMKHSALTTLAAWETGMTTVRTPSAYSATLGWSNIPFTSTFTWNGVDGIIVEINYSNNNGGTSATGMNNSAFWTATPTVRTLFYRVDNSSSTAVDAYSGTPSFTYSSRNNFKFKGAPSPQPTSYTWSPATNLYTNNGLTNAYVLNTSEDSVYAAPTTTTTYAVTAHIGACSSTTPTNVTVTVNQLPAVDAGNAQTVCPGAPVTLSGSGATSYTWSGGITNGVAFNAPNATTLYTVTGTDGNGCQNTDTVSVFVLPATPVNITPAGPIVTCQNQPVTLTANGPALGAPTTITQWNFNAGDLTPSVGSGTALNIGGVSSAFLSGAGSTDPTQPGQAWQTSAYPSGGNNPKTAGVQFNVNTSGYQNISFKYDVRPTNTAANKYVVQYNPDVTNGLAPWITVQTFNYNVGGNFINNQTVDLSAYPATNNNPNLGLRVVSDTSTGGVYVGVAGTYGTTGTVRYDMATFTGQPQAATYLWTGGSTSQSIVPPTSGTYVVTVTEPGVCPGKDSVSVTINPTYAININPVICANQTYNVFGVGPVNTTGIYTENRTSVNGCDSTVIVNLTVNPVYATTVNPTICSNQNYTLANGTQVNTAGTHIVTVPSINNCDSVVTVNLTVNPAQSIPAAVAICAGDSYTLPSGTVVTSAGVYNSVFTAANGCDSTIVTTVTVKPVFTSTQNPVICQGDMHTMPDGTQEGTQGTYTFPYTAVNGCDSTITVNLTVNPVFTTNVSVDLCPGETYTMVDNTVISTGGVFTAVTNTVNGCDSTIVVTATMRLAYNMQITAAICQGGSYTLANGTQVSAAGTYTSATQSIYGCDSLVTVTLAVNPVYNQTASASICQGQTYQLPNGTSVSAPGVYTSSLTSSKGCDSTIVTTLTVNPLPNVNLGADIVVPNPPVTLNAGVGFTSYLWNDNSTGVTLQVTQNGTYSVTVTNQFGCSASDEINVNFTSSIVNLGENGGSISLFPNPTSDRFTVNVYGYNGGGSMRFDIINAVGQVVKTETVGNATESFSKEIDVTTLASGSYTIRVKGQQAEANLRLVIAR